MRVRGERLGQMRAVSFDVIAKTAKRMCMEATYKLDDKMVKTFEAARETEVSPLGKEVLQQLIENAQIAREEDYPICQDTGDAVFFIELGQEVRVEGGGLIDAINKGVAEGYLEGYLRLSMVGDPLRRKNTGDNTPAMITLQLVPGDKLKISFLAKGGGCENMSAFKMLTPADGVKGVKEFVIGTVRRAGGNPCPPTVVGVGIGGTFDQCCMLAKKALFREIGQKHPDPFYAQLEAELLGEINKLGIGPMGLGGRITSVGVHIETLPCHITSLPVAVNMDCHAHRHMSVVL
jgi:fumarate hydratase subunit alpha